MQRLIFKAVLPVAVAAVAISFCATSQAAVFDAGAALLANENDSTKELTNPNATVTQWSYGYRATALATGAGLPLGTLFTADDHIDDGTLEGFADHFGSPCCGALPALRVNKGVNPVGDPQGSVAQGELLVHPDGDGGGNFVSEQKVVVRFTPSAADAGQYSVDALWEDVNDCCSGVGQGVDVHVVLNQGGTSVDLFPNQAVSREGGDSLPASTSFSQLVTLNLGDSLDFVIGTNSQLYGDSTRFNAVLTSVPEPATLSLIGLAGVSFIARRRGR